jgi:hypothetical protein
MRILTITAAAAALLASAQAASTPAELQGLWTFDYANPANEALTPEAQEGGSLRGYSFNFNWDTPVYAESFDGLSAWHEITSIKAEGEVTVFELKSLTDGAAKTVAHAFPGDGHMLVISEADGKTAWVFRHQTDIDAAPKLDISYATAKRLQTPSSGVGPRFKGLKTPPDTGIDELLAAACTDDNAVFADFDLFSTTAPTVTIADGKSEPVMAVIKAATPDEAGDSVTFAAEADGDARSIFAGTLSEPVIVIDGSAYADCASPAAR